MGEIKAVIPEKLIVGMLAAEEDNFLKVQKEMILRYGHTDYESPVIDFKWTNYYNSEIGENLKRKFVGFDKLIHPELLPDIKLFTNHLEKKYSNHQQQRKVNIDPGLLSEGKFILATTKNHQHRIYMKNGIYAEVTLKYTNDSFTPWEWTYPDYQSKEYIDILNDIRDIYKKQIIVRKI